MHKIKKLKYGYTTGTCAAAAARGALLQLLGRKVGQIAVKLPGSAQARLKPLRAGKTKTAAFCEIKKDAGDDPDITHGAVIRADVSLTCRKKVCIRAGVGVGIVTRPGLAVPPGEPAINPVPRRMIHEAVTSLLPDGRGAEIIISVPDGEALAKKTLNPRLGIVGGISILGTTGIVTPYSHEAYRYSIACGLDVARAMGIETVVLSTGRTSEKVARGFYNRLPEPCFILIGDYFDFAVREAIRHGMKKIIISCYPGKLLKMASGAGCTHVSRSTIDLSFLAECARSNVVATRTVNKIKKANTVRHAFALLSEKDAKIICSHLANIVIRDIEKIKRKGLSAEVIVASYSDEVMLHTV
jgi:cobalt-precorrin-5B (C1)-methyltransferase